VIRRRHRCATEISTAPRSTLGLRDDESRSRRAQLGSRPPPSKRSSRSTTPARRQPTATCASSSTMNRPRRSTCRTSAQNSRTLPRRARARAYRAARRIGGEGRRRRRACSEAPGMSGLPTDSEGSRATTAGYPRSTAPPGVLQKTHAHSTSTSARIGTRSMWLQKTEHLCPYECEKWQTKGR